MALRNDDTAWGLPARLLHWAMAVIMIGMLGLGFYTANVVTDVYQQFGLVQIHKSWGFVVFVLALLRVAWRLVYPTPALPEVTPDCQATASRRAHQALYFLMFALPLTGWLMSSASTLQEMYGIKNMVFGLFAMPDPFVPGSAALEAAFSWAHMLCAIALTAILLVHAGAALKHHFVDRDEVLTRMTKGRPQDGTDAASARETS